MHADKKRCKSYSIADILGLNDAKKKRYDSESSSSPNSSPSRAQSPGTSYSKLFLVGIKR